jgi:RNA-directed DNA polymerase
MKYLSYALIFGTVAAAKSAVDRPWRRTFLGFTCTGRRPNRRGVSDKALKACKEEVRRRTFRTHGESLVRVGGDLRRYLTHDSTATPVLSTCDG